jgi:hypothetical protein
MFPMSRLFEDACLPMRVPIMGNYARVLLRPPNCSIALPFPCFLSFSAPILHFSRWCFPDQRGLVLLPSARQTSTIILCVMRRHSPGLPGLNAVIDTSGSWHPFSSLSESSGVSLPDVLTISHPFHVVFLNPLTCISRYRTPCSTVSCHSIYILATPAPSPSPSPSPSLALILFASLLPSRTHLVHCATLDSEKS